VLIEQQNDDIAGQNPLRASDTGHVLMRLVRQLERAGYREYYASFNPLITTSGGWLERLTQAPPHLRPIIELFLLGRAVPERDVTAIIDDVPALCELGILHRVRGDSLRTAGLALVPVFGLWIFNHSILTANPTLYYGDDTLALLSRLAPRPRGSALDLCSGPGTQALFASLYADRVTAVEVNPIAAALATLNVAMNGRSEKVSIVCGDLYDAVGTSTYDLICANPPLLPFPDALAYPFVGHGGADGLRVTRRILAGLPAHLSADGVGQIIGCCLSDGILPLPAAELETWARQRQLRVLMTVTSENPLARGSFFFEGLVSTAASMGERSRGEIAAIFEDDLRRQGATHLCTYFLHVTRQKGGFVLQDLSRQGRQEFWFASQADGSHAAPR